MALAPDERSVFVAMSGSREIVRMTLDGRQPPTRSAKLGILPDNLRWSAEGALLTTGMRYDPEANLRCFSGPDCRPPIGVYKIAPGTLALADLTTRLDLPSMPLATTALQVGNELWISSLGSQRISVVALRP